MKNTVKYFCGLAIATALALSSALAQTVTLNSVDGSITLTGELTGFDGEFYTITTAVGDMSIGVTQVVCEGDGCPDLVSSVEEFTIASSEGVGAILLPVLIEAFALERGGDLQIEFGGNEASQYYILDADGSLHSTINVTTGGSDASFAALADGSAVIGFSSRAATDAEVISFVSDGLGVLNSVEQERVGALDGLIAMVNRENPIGALSLAEITQIYAGEITNWSQLGGLNASISLYRLDESFGATASFSEIAMVPNGKSFSSSAVILQSNLAVSDAVSRDINGIGIGSMADERRARALSIRSVCGQVYAPTEFTVKTEEYPLTQRIFMYTRSGLRPDRANEFLDFVSSNIGQEIVENAGYVGQNVVSVSLDNQGRRIANAIVAEVSEGSLANLQNLLTTVLDAERLSLTFRFISGTSTLDNRALGDIERLAQLIRDGNFTNRQILVLGFTDDIGSLDENAVLSQARAEQVREAITVATGANNLGNIRITPVGYGNISPLGCNETPEGRRTNRRVELWVR